MHNKIKLVVADDHPIIILGIEKLISLEDDLEIVGKAVNGRDALSLVESRNVDVAVLDISMPLLNGFDAAMLIKNIKPQVKIIFITMYENKDYIEKSKVIGVEGYILKEDAPDVLIKVIKNTMNGFMDYRIQENGVIANNQSQILNLTIRETEIVKLTAQGKTARGIACELSISEKTINCHRANIRNKLKIDTIADMCNIAHRYKLIDSNVAF